MSYISKIILPIVLVAIFGSCQKELDKTPLDAPSNVTFFSSQNELELAVNAIYTQLWWHFYNFPAPAAIENTTDLGFLRSGGLKDIGRGAGTASTGIFRSTWVHFYRGISKANNLLDNMTRAQESVPEDVYKNIEAQARFLRAFYYHFLIELYGDVPLVLSVPVIDEAQLPRTPKSKIVDQILSDLDFAAENLPDQWPQEDNGRATKYAALTLKARVALYNKRYDAAIQSAKKIIDAGQFSLYPDYEKLFKYQGIRNSEVIFDIPYQKGVRTHELPVNIGSSIPFGWGTTVPSQYLIDSYQCVDGKPIDQSPLYDPRHPFLNRDPRLEASIVRPQSEWGGFIFESHPDSVETWDVSGSQPERIVNWDSPSVFSLATFTGYLWRKYADPVDYPNDFQDSELNFILMRYAEVLLTYAEAKIENNDIDPSVLDAINAVRARGYGTELEDESNYPAVSTLSQNELRKEVRYERKIELALEGFRWSDIRRWGIADKVMNGPLLGRPKDAFTTISKPPRINVELNYHPDYGTEENLYRHPETRQFTEKDWLWAIPQDELNVNENIEQNPGY